MARGRKAFQTIENLLKNYQVDNKGCWIWQKQINNAGYGFFTFQYKSFLAHRASYIQHVGPIPEGLYLDHLCRVTACINPVHLEPVTPYENYIRGISPTAEVVRSNKCGKGHELTVGNVYIGPRGWRRCRKCTADRLEENKIEVICAYCNQPFLKIKGSRSKYCNRKCYFDKKRSLRHGV